MVPPELDDYVAPENKARIRIDEMLTRSGWVVQDYKNVNLYAGEGVAVRELITNAGPADYVLFLNRQAVGVIEAKKQGTTLAGVEWQTVKYQASIPDALPAHLTGSGHLPFGYESTGDETWFTCRFDPEPTAPPCITDNPPPPGVITAEIVDDPESALEEFRVLAESVEGIGIDIEGAE